MNVVNEDKLEQEEVVLMTKAEVVKLTVEAVREYDAKQKKSRHDRRLYNTRLLMKNYNALKAHCEKSVSSLEDEPCEMNAIDMLDRMDDMDRGVYIESIRRSNTRTRIMIEHIDRMLDLLKTYCHQTGNQRKYESLVDFYLAGKATQDIAEEQNVDVRTCQRDMKFAIEKLSALIFGIDGLAVVS